MGGIGGVDRTRISRPAGGSVTYGKQRTLETLQALKSPVSHTYYTHGSTSPFFRGSPYMQASSPGETLKLQPQI